MNYVPDCFGNHKVVCGLLIQKVKILVVYMFVHGFPEDRFAVCSRVCESDTESFAVCIL